MSHNYNIIQGAAECSSPKGGESRWFLGFHLDRRRENSISNYWYLSITAAERNHKYIINHIYPLTNNHMCTHSVSISGERAHIQLARQDSLNALWFLSTRQHHGHDNHRDQHHDHYIPWPTSSSWLLPCISIIVFIFKDTPNLEILMISITAGGWSTTGQSSGRQITFLWWEEEWFPWVPWEEK